MNELKAYFIPTLNSGVTYWRMYLPVLAACRNKHFGAHLFRWMKDEINNHPWQFQVEDPATRNWVLGEIEAGARSADILVMGLVHTAAGLTTMQGIRECFRKPVVVEIDDNVLSVPTYNQASGCYAPDNTIRKVAVQQIKEADALVVSTPYLKEIYSEFNDNIYVIPNSIDFETWGKAQMGNNKGKITIGWMGGGTHEADLAIIIPAIKHLTEKYKDVEFSFLHGASHEIRQMKNVKVNAKFERIDKYHKYVAKAGFDIGMAPLVDNAFNRGKSNLRWLEYSALGIPTVASNVGHFAETITHGATGLLSETPEDFTYNLESLIINKKLRKDIGNAAKKEVFTNWNIDRTSKRYGEVLQEIYAKTGKQSPMYCVEGGGAKYECEVLK